MAIDPALRPVLVTFLAEARGIAQQLTRCLLEIERADQTGEGLEEAFTVVARGLHTLKGTSATFGMHGLADFAHTMEDLLAVARERGTGLPEHVADALFRGTDLIVDSIRAEVEDDASALPDLEIEMAVMASVLESLDVSDGVAVGPTVASGGEKHSAEPSAADPAAAAAARGAASLDPSPEGPESGAMDAGPRTVPEARAASDPVDEIGGWRVAQRDVLFMMGEAERLRELRLRLEVRLAELERGISGLGERRSGEAFERARSHIVGLRSGLAADSQEVAEIVDSLEEGLRSICTLPVSTVLEPLHRMVRDVSRPMGKRASLSVIGGELSVDRRLLVALRSPLVHLVRNAVDHGVELPLDRERSGKHSEGALVIRIEQQGNLLFVEVSDDGGGLETERIRFVAKERGLKTGEELDRMTPDQVHQLVFEPGFSTRGEVTGTSGRGVGLDVVRKQVDRLRGRIEVTSRDGEGTRFVLTVPAELGSSPTLVLRAGDHLFGLPMIVIEQLVASRKENIQVTRSRMSYVHRDRLLPLKDLGALMGLREPAPPDQRQPLIVMQSQGRHAVVAVDEVVGDRDVVIRPLPAELARLGVYQGAATMAAGEPMLVLRPDWLVDSKVRDEGRAARRALVVDDSITARAMHRTVLESGGFAVHTATGAEAALEKLAFTGYDVVVCDLRLEGMSGSQFVAHIRQDPSTRQLPVILVSVSDDAQVRRECIVAGADAFLSKRDCASGRLLGEVESIIARRASA